MQQGDYTSSPYYTSQYPHLQNPNPNPNPNPIDHHNYASAPPFSSSSYAADFPAYPSNPDLLPPPTAPSYSTTPPPPPLPPPVTNPNTTPQSFSPFDLHGSSYNASSNQQYPYFSGSFDQQQSFPNYAPPTATMTPNPTSAFSATAYNQIGSSVSSSVPSVYDAPYDNNNLGKFDQGPGFFDGGNSRGGRYDYGADLYGKRGDDELGYGDGVFAYDGGKVEPYGARGTAPKSSTWAMFDDYGRTISFPSGKDSSSTSGVSGLSKIVRAVPKVEAQQDVKSGVQKFRVKLLAESGGQSTMDVLCQVGLDGIRMLDPSTSRTLRIYPLENITRCEVFDSSTLAFWSKSSVDPEPRRIRLQSNSYTTNTLLDIVTAATVQFKEMGGRSRSFDAPKATEQPAEKKKGLVDWMNLIRPANVEKDHWVPDEAVSKCTGCGADFSAFNRKHHCRNCGEIFCDKCTQGRTALTADENAQPVRVCDRCMAEVSQRLSNAKEVANKPAGPQSHEDLAKKLQEEMERNRKASSGSKSDGSGRRMREVACPICTVHLQVQVPSSGSETIECGVCQHPFLVSAH